MVRDRFAFFVGLLLLTWLASAEGATWPAKNRCSDVVRILKPSSSRRSADVDPSEVSGAIRSFEQANEDYARALRQIEQIPAGEFDRNDPELRECVELLDGTREHLTKLRANIEKAQKGAQEQAPLLAAARGKGQALFTLAAIHYGAHGSVLNNASPAQVRQMLADLDAVAGHCGGFDSATMPPARSQVGGSVMRVADVEMDSALVTKPAAWCFIGKNRGPLMEEAVARRFVQVEGFGNYALLIPDTIAHLSEDRPDMEAWIAEILLKPKEFLSKKRKASASFYAQAGVPAPAEGAADPLEEQLKTLWAAIDGVAPRLKVPTGPHDGSIEGHARSELKKIFANASVTATVMDAPTWTIEKNGLGVPLNRFRSGQIVFKRPESRWCMQRTFSYNEPYTGGGHFQAGGAVKVLPATRFLECR